jgi:protein-tyrosine phosphatase
MMQIPGLQPLVVDIRSTDDFAKAHIKRAVNLPLPPQNSDVDLVEVLQRCPRESVSIFNHRDHSTEIVFCGEDSSPATLGRIAFFLQLLKEEEGHAGVFLLEGGFAGFEAAFPYYCDAVAPKVAHSVATKDIVPYPSLVYEDWLFLCGLNEARQYDVLKQMGVTHIVNMMTDSECHDEGGSDKFRILHCPLEDDESEDIARYFDRSIEFIKEARASGGRVVVHCRLGISRSATVVLAFLVKAQSLTLKNAFELVSRARPKVMPNYGFWHQLAQLEVDSLRSTSVSKAIDFSIFFPNRPPIKVQRRKLSTLW